MKASAAGYSRRQSGCHDPASELPQALRQKDSDPAYGDWSKVQVLILRRTHVGEAY